MNAKGIMDIISLWFFENISLCDPRKLEIRTLTTFLIHPCFPRMKNACVFYTPRADSM